MRQYARQVERTPWCDSGPQFKQSQAECVCVRVLRARSCARLWKHASICRLVCPFIVTYSISSDLVLDSIPGEGRGRRTTERVCFHCCWREKLIPPNIHTHTRAHTQTQWWLLFIQVLSRFHWWSIELYYFLIHWSPIVWVCVCSCAGREKKGPLPCCSRCMRWSNFEGNILQAMSTVGRQIYSLAAPRPIERMCLVTFIVGWILHPPALHPMKPAGFCVSPFSSCRRYCLIR